MKNIKFISCAILVFFTMCILCIPAFALSGTGTEADPYLVSTPSDIALMHNDLDGYYKLTTNIDMKGVDFEPIGNESEGAFTGTVDGDGHTISNLDINLPGNKYVGFIGYLEGTVKNLNLENVDACGYHYVGGIAGCTNNFGIVQNCYSSGNIIGSEMIYLDLYIGGIVGYNFGNISECKTYATFSVNDYCTLSYYVGGVSGYNSGNIMNCNNYNSINIRANWSTNPTCVGGISGCNDGLIKYCKNVATMSNMEQGYRCYFGGITGKNLSGTINNCTNIGNIELFGQENNHAGGIVGLDEDGEISMCTNSGRISSSQSGSSARSTASGIVGCTNSGFGTSILNCMNFGKISCQYNGGVSYAGGVVGYSFASRDIIEFCENHGEITTAGVYPVGGICGCDWVSYANIKNCANYANIISTHNSYGIARDVSSITNCISVGVTCSTIGGYNTSNSYALNLFQYKHIDIPRDNLLNYTQMSYLESYKNFDFINIWVMNANTNSGFPQLRNMPRHIDLNECVLLLKVSESDKLEAFIDGVPESVTWSSEDGSIATVSADGTVTAVATGDIMITATNAEGMKMNCLVHVTKDVSSVSMNKTETQITAGSSETLTYTLNPVDANEVVMWASSNEAVATVDQSGVVTAKAKGTATITVTTVTSNKSASCEVTVVGAPITSVSIPSSATVNKGTPYKLSLTVSPTQYEGTVTWSSSDESVATVSQDGTVTGHKAGSAVITVKSDTGKTSTCTVTVKIPSTEFTLNKTELTIENGMTEKLIPIFTPEDTTDTVSWSSSYSSRVSVASDGTLTAKSTGTATITATTTSGLKAYCFVTVIAAKVPVSSVTLNSTELIMTKADTKQLTATVLPTNATDKMLTWTTSNEEVATVSNTGVVSAVGDGIAIITATSNNGMYHECAIKVISASGPSVVLEDAKASPSGKAVVKANIVKNPGISAYKFTVNYDRTKLTPVDISANAEFGGTFTTNLEDAERAGLNVLWHSTNDVNINGELFAVEFDVSESAQYGDSTEVYVTYGGKDICNTNGDYIALYTDGAVVNIKEPIPGDVYEDEDVNVYDLTLLARYITFLEDFTARQQEAGDVNNDLLVDIKDVVKLSQYLVDWLGATLMSETATLMSHEKPGIVVGTASVNANGEVVIPVSIKNNPGITGLNYKINYSTDELEILSITPNAELLASNFITNLGYEDERGLAVTWHQNDNMTSDGVLFTIKAKLKDGVDVGTITIIPADNNMCNQNGENVIATYAGGYVLAESYVVEEQSVSNGEFTCNMYFDKTFEEQSATAIVAFYNGTKFVKMAFVPITIKTGKIDVMIPCDEVSYTSYKVFVWQDLVSMKPLVEAKQN